jgi:hypothetical protein
MSDEGGEDEGTHPLEEEKKDGVLGCAHYKRKCQLKCPKCEEFFTCRLCHDDEKNLHERDPKKMHEMERHKVKEIKCLLCQNIQTPAESCTQCSTVFAAYHCLVCNLFDDAGP